MFVNTSDTFFLSCQYYVTHPNVKNKIERNLTGYVPNKTLRAKFVELFDTYNLKTQMSKVRSLILAERQTATNCSKMKFEN